MAQWVEDPELSLKQLVTAMMQVQSLPQELPHAMGVTKKKKKKKKKETYLKFSQAEGNIKAV